VNILKTSAPKIGKYRMDKFQLRHTRDLPKLNVKDVKKN
jgi:hypothetical protein